VRETANAASAKIIGSLRRINGWYAYIGSHTRIIRSNGTLRRDEITQ
jgi:hypothetical protein